MQRDIIMSTYKELLDDAERLEEKSMMLLQEISEKYDYDKEVQAYVFRLDSSDKRTEAFNLANDAPYNYQSL
jgi:hypothetical protein